MSSSFSRPSDTAPIVAGRPSYESFLRIKQGIGNEALRAAGLPSMEHLSYDAYVTALKRKAAESQAHAAAPLVPPAAEKARGRSVVWTGIVVAPIAIAFVVLLADILKDRPGAEQIPSATEAIAAPLTGDGLPVSLSITATEDMPLPYVQTETVMPGASAGFDTATPNLETAPVAVVEAAQKDPPVELLVNKPAAKKKNTVSVEPTEASVASAMPAPERRATAPQKKKTSSATASQSSKTRRADDFWRPLVDLLNGKGMRGARNVPAPEDRAGR
ncbi:MAG: hypothetical protein HYU58_02585 [Proteobacteria bacterium]|nr:hypothetical protein [Pseudomonadota bacterium]